MSEAEPAVQASYMKNVLEALERLGPDGRAVREADPELVQEVLRAPRMWWMPITWNLRLVEAAERALGEPRAREILTTCIHGQLDTPLWRNFARGAVRLFGLDPGSLVRWLPRAISVAFRGCGVWRAARAGEGSALLEVSDLPGELARHAAWIQSMGASGLALFRLCGVRGEVRLVAHDPATGSARFELRWEPAAGGAAAT
jgi:hypothetical protein